MSVFTAALLTVLFLRSLGKVGKKAPEGNDGEAEGATAYKGDERDRPTGGAGNAGDVVVPLNQAEEGRGASGGVLPDYSDGPGDHGR